MQPADARNVIESLFVAIGEGRYDDIVGLTTPDFQVVVMGSGSFAGTSDRDAYLATLRGIGGIVSGALRITPVAWTVDGDRIAVEAKSHAALRDGRTYSNQYHFLFELHGGRVRTMREYGDSLHVERLFGTLAGEAYAHGQTPI